MSIVDALKALYQKVTGQEAADGDIADVIAQLAENWPAAESKQ